MAKEVLKSFKGSNGQVDLYQEKIVILRKGFGAFLSNIGSNISKGDKAIFLDQIRAIEFKGGILSGEMFFNIGDSSMMGSHKDSTSRAETTIEFTSMDKKEATAFKDAVEQAIHVYKGKSTGQPTLAATPADEIKKYKDLLDSGAITQEEFDAKKKQLLSL